MSKGRSAVLILYAASGIAMAQVQAISIKDFGAKGDGTTDDTAAIQAAIDAVPNGSATIVIPTGKFRITSALVVPVTASNLTIEGHQDGVIYADIPAKGGIESRTAIRLESYFPDWGTGVN